MDKKNFVLGLAIACSGVHAVDYKFGELDVTVHAGLVYGFGQRTENPAADLVSPGNATVAGISGRSVGGRNQDDGNLNFRKNDRFSESLKAVGSIEVRKGNVGFMLRAKAWDDLALASENRPWGSSVGGYGAGQTLADSGFANRARFSGATLQEAYVFGKIALDDRWLTVRLGNQFIPWGSGWSIPGGLSGVNPLDLPAIHRPGALPEENGVPIPALYGKLDFSPAVSADAFVQFRHRASELDGCGTFFSTYDYAAVGCDKIFVAGANDVVSDNSRLFMTRSYQTKVSNAGEYGMSLNYRHEPLGTDFGFYASRYHSRIPFADGIRTQRSGVVAFVPGDPGNMNPQYAMEYPEGVRTVSLTAKTRVNQATFSGEFSYRPNQPVGLNTTDLLAALVSNVAPTLIRDQANTTPLGGLSRGWDARKATQLFLSAKNTFDNIAGAESITVGGEIGIKRVNDLPDVSVRRYGRSDVFGLGPVNGVCTGAAKQCSNDGFVTASAWGYRIQVSANYPGVLPEVDLAPSLTFGHDVKGWSFDDVFNEGRKFFTVALRAYYKKIYFLDVVNYSNWGGEYNNQKDRDYFMAAIGMRF